MFSFAGWLIAFISLCPTLCNDTKAFAIGNCFHLMIFGVPECRFLINNYFIDGNYLYFFFIEICMAGLSVILLRTELLNNVTKNHVK